MAQQHLPSPPVEVSRPPATANGGDEKEEAPLPGDWAPELLDGMLASPNPAAADSLLRATFAAGPRIVPQLAEALTDDRTAEYAAQSLAFIGGEEALKVLWKLQEDKRDLNLRRFFYGALSEFDTDQATQVLLDVINKSDSEPDRTVTEAAILALTVRTDPKLPAMIRQAEKQLRDVVIRDDVENTLDVIQFRSKYLATPEGRKAGGSIEEAVRSYFIPALEPSALLPPGAKAPEKPSTKVEIQNLTFSEDRMRALASVSLENPAAVAKYVLVLQKRLGDWTVASAWLGGEVEKPGVVPQSAPADKK
jgi:hypothetical protein